VETWDAIRSRRNVRDFADRPIAREHLERILEAGRRAPSSQNWQPWDFLVVTEREHLQDLAKVWQGAGHVAKSAATVALVSPVPENQQQRDAEQYDLGQATMSMMITAADLGIGSGHAAVADQQLAQRLLGFPDGRFCAYLIAMGYPADRPLRPIQRPNRRPFDEVVHWERW
jgi:nitroreductase